jgi:hypothetical protein
MHNLAVPLLITSALFLSLSLSLSNRAIIHDVKFDML